MRRRVYDEPVQVEVLADRPTHFTWDGRGYEVITFVKMLGLQRPREDVDTQLWQVRAQATGSQTPATYELRRDHGVWQLAAIWEPSAQN
ncbi:hypothetical protein [Actinoallomurus vinaceus]|uniref:hypothetical protein n=1 Tax=Actinoallomurus vinaceus TaxID=1080074 RepID=UPI0031E9F730